MTSPRLRLAALAVLTVLGHSALAASVTCQSRNNQREDCSLRGRGEVVLVRQLSKTTCEKGRNWDETRQGLYVTDGCGGVFETRDSGYDRPGQGGGWGAGGNPNPGGGWGAGGNPNPGGHSGNGYSDLVGVRASSGESELQRRGFREARSQGAPGGRFVFWRMPSRGCLEVRVVDGRFQTLRPVDNSACDATRPLPPTAPDRPVQGGGRPQGPDPIQCLVQNTNEGAVDAVVERRTQVRPGLWEFVIRLNGARSICRTDDRGRMISLTPG